MDFWLVAAVAGAGYVSKYWQNISKDWDRNGRLLQLSSGDSDLKNPESPNRPLRSLLNGTKRQGNVAKGKTVTDTTFYDNTMVDGSSGAEVASTSGNFGNYQNLRVFSVSNLQSSFSDEDLREYESGNRLTGNICDDYFGNVEEMDSIDGSVRNISPLRTKLSRGHFVKPVNSMESCLMAQLYKEHAEIKEYVLSSLPSSATPNMRDLFVTDGNRVIGNARRHSFSGEIGSEESKMNKVAILENKGKVNGIPLIPRIESSDHSKKMKAKAGNGQNGKLSSSSTTTNGKDIHRQGGLPDGMALFCLGISIGIISSLMTCRSEANKLKELLKQNENLVQDLQEELELKDSLTVKELANENDESHDTSNNAISERPSDAFAFQQNTDSITKHDNGVPYIPKAEESSESISKIEAELEAELERLGLNMNVPNSDRRLSDVIELDPDFLADFAQGELRVDMLGVDDIAKSKSNDDGTSTSTTNHSGNQAVSPRELSMRLHEIIQSRLEERVIELETALQNSQRKIQIMESGRKNWGELANGQLRFSSMPESPATREHNSMPRPPLVMDLSGHALDAYNEAREELMKMSDSEEEDSPRRIYEDIPCSHILHGVFQDQDDMILESMQDSASPEENPLELFHSNVRMQEEHISLVLRSNDAPDSREDEISDCEDEVEKELIKQIVKRTKKGSPVVINAQRLLFSSDENEHLDEIKF